MSEVLEDLEAKYAGASEVGAESATGGEDWADDEAKDVILAALLADLKRWHSPEETVEEVAARTIDQKAEAVLAKIEQAVGEVPDRVVALKLIAAHVRQHPGVADEDVIDGMFLNRDRDTDELRENYREVEFEIDSKKRVAGVRFTGDRDRLKNSKFKGRSF